MGVMVKKTGGGKQISVLVKHLKYIGFRAREKEVENKGFFNEKQDNGVDYNKFINEIKENKALQHPNSNKYHKFVFSLSKNEYKNSNRDFKDLLRCTLARYEKNHNLKLNWIGSFHGTTEHPHCHVVISGVSKDKKSDGCYKRIYFDKDRFKELRDNFQIEVDRDMVKTYEQDHKPSRLNSSMSLVSDLFERMARELQKDAEREREHDK